MGAPPDGADIDHQGRQPMLQSPTHSPSESDADQRRDSKERPTLAGITVREEDIEAVKGIRVVAYLFRGMATLLLLLAAVQIFSAVTSAVTLSVGVLFAEEVRLMIFAGLLWGAGDMAVLGIKSHHDLRATRILVARVAYMMRQMGEEDGRLPPAADGSRADRAT